MLTMTRNNHAACFFSGMFLANSVPHFIHGISGDPFPTPFAEPPGKGLSSPTVNVAWAFANIIAGYNLYREREARRRIRTRGLTCGCGGDQCDAEFVLHQEAEHAALARGCLARNGFLADGELFDELM